MAKDSDSASPAATDFDIPEQPLGAALERFMTLSNVMVVVDSVTVGSRKSNAIRGAFPPNDALRSLLAGTGLNSLPIGPSAYMLVPVPHAAEAQRLPRFMDYAAAVQRAAVASLCRRDDTRPTNYRTVIRLWLRPEGTVQRVELAVSTGSPGRDIAIADMLQRIEIDTPVPANLPQPIKLAITPRTTDDTICFPDHASARSRRINSSPGVP
ncbi:MAG: hypothetical protein HXX10_06060 [Rhodoplanes sp.]|uniref:STN domain-containing protein n=1 Tax=Rhodoplanes sp. TaxID=1968906 RepID=UPI0017C28BF5|nr:STN domain-containing protein [Rhodoplanes sp.]NVO13585.1 hypothetical protein [Rhodoplanes sp.]